MQESTKRKKIIIQGRGGDRCLHVNPTGVINVPDVFEILGNKLTVL